MSEIIENLTASIPFTCYATANRWGGVDIKVHPSNALRHHLDFVRVAEDDGTYRVIHFTHNEVIRGEATFSNSLVGLLSTVVNDIMTGI